jgi:hypothetical protein
MRALRLTVGTAAAVLVVLAGCGPETDECKTDCPPIADTYRILSSTVTGTCSFAAILLPPTLDIRQSADRSTALATVLDPANNLPIEIAARIFVPEDPEEDHELVAALSGFAYTSRPVLFSGTEFFRLQHTLQASIILDDDEERRVITGTFSTLVTPEPASRPARDDTSRRPGSCTQTLSFFGEAITISAVR